ncbi:siderophore ABC transporter substrate-binding protein [Proteus myxofaciens]|uniref:Ferric anguibactin-binding protein n=1 Tax=Proteus myxofaciens ATCC 19692 TaxID=1354337 RepID=A0A198G074_9GAMM|nr:siderophore ABC transporter substrate-binding protein [Proteus myxofaciens]OAT30129.1 ferric anguibactin-binding protein [Proteus myxofaciens ATCC 19692]
MFKKSLSPLFLLLSSLVIAGCDNAQDTSTTQSTEKQTLTIEHAQGKTEIPAHPKKTVVMNMETLDIIDALDVPIVGLPQTNVHLPKFLSKYSDSSKYTNEGGLFEPNYEQLSNTAPDLILGGSRARDVYPKLSEIAPTISMDIDSKHFIDSLTERTTELGQIFGKEEQAKKLLADFNSKIDTVKTKTPDAGTAMVVLVSGGKISAYGPGSRFGFIYDVLGFKPAYEFDSPGAHGNIVNSELLLKLNPDWMFVIDRDAAIGREDSKPAKEVLDNALVRKVSAWNKDQIIYLDANSIYISGGIQTYSNLMDTINQALDNKK